jgi:hypothetical protein
MVGIPPAAGRPEEQQEGCSKDLSHGRSTKRNYNLFIYSMKDLFDDLISLPWANEISNMARRVLDLHPAPPRLARYAQASDTGCDSINL